MIYLIFKSVYLLNISYNFIMNEVNELNIDEREYQKDIINGFIKRGWIKKEKNNSLQPLDFYDKNELRKFLKKRYKFLIDNDLEISEIFSKIDSKINTNSWFDNNVSGLKDILNEGISTNYTKENEKKPYFLIDLNNPHNNNLSIQEEVWISYRSRVDIINFVNGLPLYIWELKTFKPNSGNLIKKAIAQIQRYVEDENTRIATFNLGLLVSQTIENTYIGSPKTSNEFWFKPIKNSGNFESLLDYFEMKRIIDLIKWGTLFKNEMGEKNRIILRPHQYDSVIKSNDRISQGKGGYIWHTQGSGKTLTISALINSLSHFEGNSSFTTIIDVDRTELVDNMFNTLKSVLKKELGVSLKKAKSASELKNFLSNSKYRGVIVTTTQKFHNWGLLSEREDLLLISDEAHRTHSTPNLIDEKTYLSKINECIPNAIKIGFTGTPIFEGDKKTYDQFGKEIDKYTMKDAEEDGIITKIYFSFAEIKLKLKENADLSGIDNKRLKSSRIPDESLHRNEVLIDEIIKSFTKNKLYHKSQNRKDTYKSMIVTNSIKQGWIIYNKILELNSGIKISFVASPNRSNQEDNLFNFLNNTDKQKKDIENFKDPFSNIEIMIVTDKLLTGYDVPNLRMMYIDKEIKSHNLLQTIARVNRRYKNKNEGFVTSFRNIQGELIEALNTYRNTTNDNEELVKYITSSDSMFDDILKKIENLIPIEYKKTNKSLYINKKAYEIKKMDDYSINKIKLLLDELERVNNIVYNVESKSKKWKVVALLYLRNILNVNGSNWIAMSDEQFAKVLDSVEVDGEIQYSILNKSLDELLSFSKYLPESQSLEILNDAIEKIIKLKSDNSMQEKELLQRLKEIIAAYNKDITDMKKFVNEINKMKSFSERLVNPSKWTKYMIEVLKKYIDNVSFENVTCIDEGFKNVSDNWYTTYQSTKGMKGEIFKILNDKNIMGCDIDNEIIEQMIKEFIENSREVQQ